MRPVLLLIILPAIGCGLPFDIDDQDLPMTVTDADTYVLDVDSSSNQIVLEVPFTLTNVSDRVLTMVHCGKEEPDFSRLEGDQWEILPGGPELSCLALTHVQPGELFNGVARLWWEGSPTPAELAGVYRLHWGRLWAEFHDYDPDTKTWGTRLPVEALISNTFEVVVP